MPQPCVVYDENRSNASGIRVIGLLSKSAPIRFDSCPSASEIAECVQAIRSPVAPDPETEAECIAFIREAFASSDRRTVIDIQNVLADVCQRGYADRAAIWNEHHLNKPPTERGWPQNPQIYSKNLS